MTAPPPPRRRGWCPSLHDPMPSGDGLLVRVKPPGARLPAPAARALADAAARWGNGTIELTRRGNLQVRGLRPDGVAPFAAAVAAAGLADPDPARERRRVAIAPPLAGDDPAADASNLAERIDAALADGPLPPSKFGITVDAGGVLGGCMPPADISVRVHNGEHWLSLNGGPEQPVTDPVSACSLSLRERAGVRGWASASPTLQNPQPDSTSAPHIPSQDSLTPTLSRREREPAPSVIGFHPYAGTSFGALALGLPMGQLDAPTLHALADLADRFSAGTLRTTPWRAILLGRLPAADLPAARRAAEAAGLAHDPADPRLAVTSCIGAPGCASATVPARQDAIRLARERRGPLHVSGCAKGCAYPGAGPALVAAAGQYTLVPDWRPTLDPAP